MKISTAANLVAFSCYVSSVSVQADEQQQRQACTSDDVCAGATVEDGPGEYCSTVDQTCLAAGDCTGLADCTENLSNIFAVPMCIGTMYCMEDAASSSQGRCVNICLGTPSTCDALDACVDAGLLEGECCPTTDGTFLACCFADPDDGTEEDPTVPVDDADTDPDDNSPAEDDSLMNEMMMGVDDADSPTDGDGNADADDSIPGTLPADPDEDGENPDSPINAEEIGGNNCESKVACRDCLADDTSTCGWVPAVEGCLESCTIIADASCYNMQSFNRDNNNNNNNMMTGEDICVVAENELTDKTLCKSQTDCTSCIDTNLVSETSSWKTCQWFPEGNYCSSGCGMAGCGETICSTDSADDGQEMTAMVGDPLPSVCVADSDCNTSSPDSDDDFYCATGTCLPQGGCRVDTDCVNPSNYGIKDTRCVGYLFCDTTSDTVNPVCDRQCTGFACPGEVPATDCSTSVTGCDTRIACQGSVNCVVDQCDANCKGLFFDSSGTVLEECTGGKGR